MTVQQAYELMRVYLTRPGACQALGENGCMYETAIGYDVHRCAVGCLLTEQDLSQEIAIDDPALIENNETMLRRIGQTVQLRDFSGTLADVLAVGYTPSILVTDDELQDELMFDFLASAQTLHDTASHWKDGVFEVWRLDELARRHGLRVVSEEEVGVPQETQVQEPVAVGASVV